MPLSASGPRRRSIRRMTRTVKRERRLLTSSLLELRQELDLSAVPERRAADVADWQQSHRPFHWWAEFYDVMARGGFDVVVGNRTYVRRVNIDYTPAEFESSDAPDIYAAVLERSLDLLKRDGRIAMIVMLNLAFSTQYRTARTAVTRRLEAAWFSHFGRIPDYLFSDDVRVRNTIVLGRRGHGVSTVGAA